MGRLAPCLHPFWVRRPLLGCLRATGTLGTPSHLHSAPSPLQSRVHPQGCPLPGVLQGPPLSAPALKRGPVICPSPPSPWDALKGSTSASDTASLFTSSPFFPGLEAADQSPWPGKSSSGRTSRSFQTPTWMAALEPSTVLIYSVLAQCGPTLESCWLGVSLPQ